MKPNPNETQDRPQPGYSLDRVKMALAGKFDASLLSDDEAAMFDELFGAANNVPEMMTAEARAFYQSFAGQPNTDRSAS